MPEQNDRLIRYSMQIAYLGRLLKEKLISEYEYSLIRKNPFLHSVGKPESRTA